MTEIAAAGKTSADRWPESTYRLQFHAGFTFGHATAIVPYFADLGVTHLYASPFLKARPGSMHGYDIIDHCSLNPELGTPADLDAMVDALHAHGMKLILDMAPNHVGVGTNDNLWWNDVLARGPASRYAKHFDITWRGSPRESLKDKVLLPVLGEMYGAVLDAGQLQVKRDDAGLAVHYYDRRFPISPETSDLPEPKSPHELDLLLNRQHYRLCYWRVASDEINYRRFFDINDLAALRMELPEVFEATHGLVFELLRGGKIDGLRIDHPDGLYDPRQYFERLQEKYKRISPPATGEKPLYVVAEKILAADEPLPPDWPVHGTTGYDFLNQVNGLFVDAAAAQAFTKIYRDFTGRQTPIEDLVYEKKRLILETSLSSELHMLTAQLDAIAQSDRCTRDFTLNGLRHALRDVIACFPVYRSYITDDGAGPRDAEVIDTAVAEAKRRNPQISETIFEFIRDALLKRDGGNVADLQKFAGKFQQLTAPVTAKGIEDTAFYIDNRFVSLNEVGGDPARFGVSSEALHRYFTDRQANWPYSMSCLSTHDTKRSEDVRARLNVLSEIPAEWEQHVQQWRALAAPLRLAPDVPDANDEYLIYQTLVGAMLSPTPDADFIQRIQAYLQKAMREAKVHTSWTDNNEAYEKGTSDFIQRLLTAPAFLEAFVPFQQRVARHGLINSLSQTLLKFAAPGVPDTYQGTELLDFSLVDPDNRRPVDYGRRQEMLGELKTWTRNADDDWTELLERLRSRMGGGYAKLFVSWQALEHRRQNVGLFTAGEYLPATVSGGQRECVFAFARRSGDRWALAAAMRFSTRVEERGWGDTVVNLPGAARGKRWRDVFSGAHREVASSICVAELFERFPVALLVGE